MEMKGEEKRKTCRKSLMARTIELCEFDESEGIFQPPKTLNSISRELHKCILSTHSKKLKCWQHLHNSHQTKCTKNVTSCNQWHRCVVSLPQFSISLLIPVNFFLPVNKLCSEFRPNNTGLFGFHQLFHKLFFYNLLIILCLVGMFVCLPRSHSTKMCSSNFE